jgi:hypothetical protein
MRPFLLGLLLGTLGSILVDRVRSRLKIGAAQDSSRATAATGTERSAEQASDEGPSTSHDLSRLTAAELYRRALLAGIAGRSGMSKAQLIAALRAVNGW